MLPRTPLFVIPLIPLSLASTSIPPPSSYSLSTHNPTTNTTLHNGPSLFNALHALTKQWHESIHHNGLSYFLATIPAGTRLHHGRGGTEDVRSGMEWLAFEPEHASNFAVGFCFEGGGGDDDGDIEGEEKEEKLCCEGGVKIGAASAINSALGGMSAAEATRWRTKSLKWLFPSDFRPPHHSESTINGRAHPFTPPPPPPPPPVQHPLSQSQPQPIPPPQSLTFCPGHLHTFTPTRALRLLYLSGMSAAKSPIGTLASQDLVLLRDSNRNRTLRVFDDLTRAKGLCELAAGEFEGKVDGFVRMEHGFEVLLCDFGLLRREGVVERAVRGKVGGDGWDVWQFWGAVVDRYFGGVGRGRLRVETGEWVSVLAEEGVDVWKDSEDGVLPNISRIDEGAAGRVREGVRRLVVDGLEEEAEDGVDWGAVAELYVTRYARRLMFLSSKEYFGSAEERANATRRIYGAYMNGTDDEVDEAAAGRCINAFVPPHFMSLPQAEWGLSQRAVTAVASEICSTLYDITTTLADEFDAQQQRLDALMKWLQWPEFKMCSRGRGCELDELCFVAIWPLGDKNDHDQPACWTKTALFEHFATADDYWRMHELWD